MLELTDGRGADMVLDAVGGALALLDGPRGVKQVLLTGGEA